MKRNQITPDLSSNNSTSPLGEVTFECMPKGLSELDLRKIFSRRRVKEIFWTPDFPIDQVKLRAFLIACSAYRHALEFKRVRDGIEGACLEDKYLRKYKSRPTFNIVETCGALQAGLFTEDDIAEIYFKIIDHPFKKGQCNWSVHELERPIHVFTREGLADAICKTISTVNTEAEHPAFTFYVNLRDKVAFANLTMTLLQQGICKETFARILKSGKVFASWQYCSIVEVGDVFVREHGG